MTLVLEIVGGSDAPAAAARKEFLFSGGSIGRSPDNDWVIPDRYISGHHARIHFRDDGYFVEDVSTNGTYVDSRDTRLLKGELYPLQSGMRIFLDELEIQVSHARGTAETEVGTRPADSEDERTLLIGKPVRKPTEDATSFLPPELVPRPPIDSKTAKKQPRGKPRQKVARTQPDAAATELFAAPRPSTGDATQLMSDEQHRSLAAGTLGDATAWMDSPPATPASIPAAPKASARTPPPTPVSTPAEGSPDKPPSAIEALTIGAASESVDLAVLLEAAGLPRTLTTPELARDLGLALRAIVEELLGALNERKQFADELHMQRTRIARQFNNPLKFSANVEDAMHNLFLKSNPAYLDCVASLTQAMREIRAHNLAMQAALRAAFDAAFEGFDPVVLEPQLDQAAGQKRSLFGKRDRWAAFETHYRTLSQSPEAAYRLALSEHVAPAYERELRRVNSTGGNS